MHPAAVVAQAFQYPTPSTAADLETAVDASLQGVLRRHLRAFLTEIGRLELGRWEELHTSTLDLSPLFVPYVGHVVWGDNYRRGAFMADLKAAMADAGVDLRGELPDHVEPVLRYLAAVEEPMVDLVDVFPGAVADMERALTTADPGNPYRHVLAAVVALSADLRPLSIGRRP